MVGRTIRPSADDCGRERLFRREMMMDARALDAHVGRDFPKTEAGKAAGLHPSFGRIHDRCFHVTHGTLFAI